MSYKHLTQEERYQIYAYKKIKMSLSEIALELNRNKSTISREISRNTGKKGYRPQQAHSTALKRAKNAPKAIKMTLATINRIEKLIKEDWSPEQVSGRLLRESVFIGHETIYQHILLDKKNEGKLYTHLRCQKKKKEAIWNKVT